MILQRLVHWRIGDCLADFLFFFGLGGGEGAGAFASACAQFGGIRDPPGNPSRPVSEVSQFGN